MARARDLEEDLLLALQHDLAIVDPARLVHQPVDLDEMLGRQPFVFFLVRGAGGAAAILGSTLVVAIHDLGLEIEGPANRGANLSIVNPTVTIPGTWDDGRLP